MSLRACLVIATTLLALLLAHPVIAQEDAETTPPDPVSGQGDDAAATEGDPSSDAAPEGADASDEGDASAEETSPATESDDAVPEGDEALPDAPPGGFESGDTVVDGEEGNDGVLAEEPELPMPDIERGVLSPYGDLMSVPPAETSYSDVEIAGLVIIATGTATTIVGGLLWANDLDTAGSATLGTGAGIALVGAGLMLYELRAEDFEQAYSDEGMRDEGMRDDTKSEINETGEGSIDDAARPNPDTPMPVDVSVEPVDDTDADGEPAPAEGDSAPNEEGEGEAAPEDAPAEPDPAVLDGESSLPKLAPGVTWLPDGGVMFGLQGRF